MSWTDWASGVLSGIGAPLSQTNYDSLFAWSSAETAPYPLMRWDNPLNDELPEPGSVSENSVGVQGYPTVQEGIDATVTTLSSGLYPTIVSHLRNSVPHQQWQDACAELDKWGTGCGWIANFYGAAPGVITSGGIDLATADDIMAKLDTSFADLWTGNGWPVLASLNQQLADLKAEIAAVKTDVDTMKASGATPLTKISLNVEGNLS